MSFLTRKQIYAAVVTGVVIGIVMIANTGKATQSGAATPFGGAIEQTQDCTCSGTYWLSIGNPNSAKVVYQAGTTILYEDGQIFRTGPNVLGLYQSGGECEYGEYCEESKQVDGTITIIGNSKN